MPEIAQRARYRRNQAYVAKLSVQAVDRLFEASGGHVLFDSNPMQRFHRDAHAASHHFGIHWETLAEEYGRVRLGLELKNPGRI
jgi:alkylation response protein AidB-like acyl-CoA dehydrogenase